MKLFWHLIKYNLIFNKVRMMFLILLSIFIILVGHYFYDEAKEMGQAFMQYSFYVMFMIFTGKTTSKNGMMFDIKHLVGLPLSKRQIVLLKSVADSFQMLPIAFVFLYGVFLAFPEYHLFIVIPILFIAITFSNIIAFNKRVDFSRMQHSKASFKNSFLYLHKYIDSSIQLGIIIFIVMIIFAVFNKNIFMQEYSFFIFLIVVTFLSSSNAVRMLKDETMSYFVMKRDVIRIGLKLIVVLIPLLFIHQVYKGSTFKSIANEIFNKDKVNLKWKMEALASLEKISDPIKKDFMVSLIEENIENLKKHIKDGQGIPWEIDINGAYPIHLAVILNNQKILDLLLKANPEMINRQGKINKTPVISTAMTNCNLKMVEHLIAHKADLNSININGDTPLIVAAKNKCYGGIILLQKNGANLALKNNEGLDLYQYIDKSTGIPYLLGDRGIAGEEDSLEAIGDSRK